MRRASHPIALVITEAIALAITLAAQPGCGIAQRAARSATEGAIGTLAEKAGDREAIKRLSEGITRRTAGGVLDEVSQPQRLDDLQRIAAALAAGSVSGATRAAPVEAMSERAASAFSRQIIAGLGHGGEGPVATSLAATTEQMTESIARGARGELAPLFPECRGADASRCLDHAVERVSRAGAGGLAAGIRDALGGWPLVFAFGAGALAALALAWAGAVYQASRPALALRHAPRAVRPSRSAASMRRRRGD
jgi:hypothetical protein